MDRSRLNRFVNQQLREFPLDAPVFVSLSDPLSLALGHMREGARSCVLLGGPEALEGIFTERDVLTKCMSDGFDWAQPMSAGPVTRQPHTIAATRTVGEAIAAFQKHSYRTLPVVDGGRVVGLFRVGDVLRHFAEAFPEEILNLPPRPHQVMEKQEGG
jgi:CBS domain-containing protein